MHKKRHPTQCVAVYLLQGITFRMPYSKQKYGCASVQGDTWQRWYIISLSATMWFCLSVGVTATTIHIRQFFRKQGCPKLFSEAGQTRTVIPHLFHQVPSSAPLRGVTTLAILVVTCSACYYLLYILFTHSQKFPSHKDYPFLASKQEGHIMEIWLHSLCHDLTLSFFPA